MFQTLFRPAQVFARCLRATQGVAAVEFACVLPLMLLLSIGTVEVAEGVAIDRQVVFTASTVASLVTQYSSISSSQTMPDILNAAAAVLTPYPVSKAVVTVSSINIDAGGQAAVAWSKALNGSGRPTGQTISLPAALDVPNTTLILGETTYAYTPFFDYIHIGTLHLSSSVYMAPRVVATITLAP